MFNSKPYLMDSLVFINLTMCLNLVKSVLLIIYSNNVSKIIIICFLKFVITAYIICDNQNQNKIHHWANKLK